MNTKTVLACTAVVIAFALIVAPLVVSEDALAKNKAKQKISQKQSSSQSSVNVNGGSSALNGNNINLQFQGNSGSNTLGQSSSD